MLRVGLVCEDHPNLGWDEQNRYENLREEIRDYVAGLFESLSDSEIEEFSAIVQKFVLSGRARRERDLEDEGFSG